MDDDLYNAVDNDDVLGHESVFAQDCRDEETTILNELSNTIRRVSKRPLMLDSCDAIDWHMRVPCTFEEIEGKRRKNEHNEILLNRLTQRILMARKRNNLSTDNGEDTVVENKRKTESSVLKFPPIDGTPWIAISSPDCSKRFYLRLKKPWVGQNFVNPKKAAISEITGLAVSKARKSLDDSYIGDSELKDTLPLDNKSKFHEKLLVDKYSPHLFAELVSDDRINRLLLNWMKMWDECVFQKPITDAYNVTEEVLTLDDGFPRRPKYKVVLIAGPAGTGKTTLAEVVARHAGYVITEVNASDDRNVADFEKRIESAVRTVKTLDADSKPICLLLDEIDGAPSDSIRLLCKIVCKTGKKCIRRPIVCICNNLYTSSLRELRSISLVLQMPHVQNERLVKRLRQIAQMEEICIDNSALSKLVSVCGSDLRSCLNTLQYVATRFSSCAIDSQMIIKYDNSDHQFTEGNLFDAWSCVLEQKKHIDSRGKLRSLRDRAQRVLIVTERLFADTNRFFIGLFANYLNSAFGTNGILLVQKAIDRLCDSDLMLSFINHSSNYTFMKYTFVLAAMIHFLISSSNRIQLVYPSVDQVSTQKRNQSCETLQCLKYSSALSTVSDRILVLDFLPLFIFIVQPSIKQANTQLFSERESRVFKNIVSTMRFYSITYRPMIQDGNTVFNFYPAIDLISHFPLDDVEEVYDRLIPLTKNFRQAIAHQIELTDLKKNSTTPTSNINEGKQERPNLPLELSPKEKKQTCLFYRYNQGFSNAIRRNLRMRNLIFDN